ncbi:MAG: nucleotidyltransferase domain-containing protein [Pseudomonadota bacterium]
MNLQTLRTNYRDGIIQLAAKHKLGDVRVFGSVVRGEQHLDSDIDFLVHPQKGCSLLDISAFEVGVSALMGGHKIDVLDDLSIKPVLAPYILSEAVPL